MKKSILFILAFITINITTLKAQDNAAKRANCKVRVDFGSPGSGIDLKGYDNIKKLFDDKKVQYKEVPNGREGEVYFCSQLEELKSCKRKRFIKELKKTAKAGQYISVSSS
jgi:hypothetical protein